MPLVSIRIGDARSGVSSTLLFELVPGVDYCNISRILNNTKSSSQGSNAVKRPDKAKVQELLSFGSSDRERQLIKYALYTSSGMTQTQARREYDFENMNAKVIEVERCLVEARKIREAIDNLARIQDKAFLATLGVFSESDEDHSSNTEDEEVPCAFVTGSRSWLALNGVFSVEKVK